MRPDASRPLEDHARQAVDLHDQEPAVRACRRRRHGEDGGSRRSIARWRDRTRSSRNIAILMAGLLGLLYRDTGTVRAR